MPENHCNVHKDEMEVIHEVRTDVKWLKRFGGWWMALTGGMVALLIPIMVSFFVYMSKVEARLCVVEYKISKMTDK